MKLNIVLDEFSMMFGNRLVVLKFIIFRVRCGFWLILKFLFYIYLFSCRCVIFFFLLVVFVGVVLCLCWSGIK